jgi:hypothetical protein
MFRIPSWPSETNFFRKLRTRGFTQPVLLNHFFKLTAEHIHLASDVIPHTGSPIALNRVTTQCDVEPVSLFAFNHEVVPAKIGSIWLVVT